MLYLGHHRLNCVWQSLPDVFRHHKHNKPTLQLATQVSLTNC